ncbi:MAG: isopentenyl-diphosphate Delta-isomerase [Candidatus Doudnabacteria bacterium]|nr:isopentenyl-diphosphate Delta-isomerase [Candidatus Doudnabacteria bacterium]
MQEHIVLVNEQDEQVGTEEKLRAHELGLLHRAFSIFVFNSRGELMLQQRALHKYHCGGLWTNTCCSHPRVGEGTAAAAHRRLQEEMGFDCELREVFSFVYKVPFANGLTEHEFDHVFVGTYDADPVLNPEEAAAWKWISPTDLQAAIAKDPDNYTYWLKVALPDLLQRM